MTTSEFTREFTDDQGTRWRLAGVQNGRPNYEVWNKLRFSSKLGVLIAGIFGSGSAVMAFYLAVNDFTGVGVLDNIAISPSMSIVMVSVAYMAWQLRVNRRRVPGAQARPWSLCLRCYAKEIGVKRVLQTALGKKLTLWASVQTILMVDDVTVVGAVDNAAQLPVGVLVLWYLSQIFVRVSRYRWIT